MRRRIPSPLLLLALFAILLPAASRARAHSPAFERAVQRLDWIARNGERPDPSPRPTVLTADEWNAYLNEGGIKLPAGVTGVRITSEPGIAQGEANIDFDRLTENRTRSNPLLFLFTGRHQVTITAHGRAIDGIATVHVDTVTFDGMPIPRFALEFFASRFLQPRFGKAYGLDSTFALHNRIDTAVIGNDQVTLTQR
jgi:hypothetical protein